jgi:hypothetical protein
VKVGKTPYVRFDWNDYSVPHTQVRRTLYVIASEQQVRIFDGMNELCSHPRSFDRGAQIEIEAHLATLVEHKRRAHAHRACDRLAQAAPASATLLQRAAERGYNLGSITAALTGLLARYGAAALQVALLDALARDVPHPNAVRLALERAREAHGGPPPLPLNLSEPIARRDAPVPVHPLAAYDLPATPDKDTDHD